MEKSIDDIMINVRFSLRQVHLINECLRAICLISLGRETPVAPLWEQYEQIMKAIINAVKADGAAEGAQQAIIDFVTDTYIPK